MSSKESLHKVAIVIVTYNGMAWIPKTLKKLPEGQHVIVVDNASSDETVGFISGEYPGITLIPLKENIGFGQANNKGISLALQEGAEAVFLLNQDAYLEENTLKDLFAMQKSFPEYGILSPVHLNGKGDRLDTAFAGYVTIDKAPDFLSDHILGKPIQPVYDVPFVNAAGWLLSRKALRTAGGFDPIFFMYGEDNNLCQRMHFHGFKIGVVPGTYLKHDRDEREEAPVEKYSKAYFRKKRVFFLNKLADLTNSYYQDWYLDQVDLRKKKKLLQAFRMDFDLVRQQKKELKLLERCFEQAVESRKINRAEGPHYL